MKNLITGGAGFIGSHLAEALLARGEEVTVLDNLSTGRMDNIKHLMSSGRFKFYKGTVLDGRLVNRLVRNSGAVYHLAAAVGVKYIIDNPLESIRNNVDGTETVLAASCHYGRRTFLASTSEIYGKDRPGKRVFSENDDRVTGPTTMSRWSYSCTKAIDEFLALAYWREKKLPVVIGRFFNTCGPRQTGRYGMVVPRFVKQAVSNDPITIYGDGKQTRCFTDVRDAVRAVILLMGKKACIGEVFNIGNPYNKVTINKLAGRVKNMTRSGSTIRHIPYKDAYALGFEDMRHREPDISKLKKITGFEPRIDMDEMLETIIRHTRSGNNE